MCGARPAGGEPAGLAAAVCGVSRRFVKSRAPALDTGPSLGLWTWRRARSRGGGSGFRHQILVPQ